MTKTAIKPMARTATKKNVKTFRAILHVTRIEEWCVEADTPERARELLASGAGYRCHIGDRLHAEVDRIHDESAK
jgi:hypothetical protein